MCVRMDLFNKEPIAFEGAQTSSSSTPMETATSAESTNAQWEEFVSAKKASSRIQQLILVNLPAVGPTRTLSTESAESVCWAPNTTNKLSRAFVETDGS